ncbi:MAG: 3'-5' exonuclease [Lachnospiraceae bacterium]|nr:3'-5' exonuclease [Lachnospiraceae bacterium]
MEPIIFSVDTETTGLDPATDEILQLSIVDGSNEEIFNEYFCPSYHLAWDKAAEINHITREMVQNKPTFGERLDAINLLFERCEVFVGYNAGFDLRFLKKSGVIFPENMRVIDVQQMFMGKMAALGEWDHTRDRPKWRSLRECAEFCGYKWEGEAHNSLADAKAALACYKVLSGR